MKPIIWIILGWLFILTASQAASFDCGKAKLPVEILICSDPALSELDLKLAARYRIALDEGNDTDDRVLRNQQLKWLREVRNRCLDASCLHTAYIQRTNEFNWITTNAEDAALCEEFRKKDDERVGLYELHVNETETDPEDGNSTIQHVDIDGDKVSDKFLLFRPGSASKIAPDNSTFTMRISSTKKQYMVEAMRLSVITYKSKYFLLTSEWLDDDGPLQDEIYLLDRTGIKKICSAECRLPSGQCGNR